MIRTAMGAKAAQMLLAKMAQPHQQLPPAILHGHIVERDSVAILT